MKIKDLHESYDYDYRWRRYSDEQLRREIKKLKHTTSYSNRKWLDAFKSELKSRGAAASDVKEGRRDAADDSNSTYSWVVNTIENTQMDVDEMRETFIEKYGADRISEYEDALSRYFD